MADLLPFAQAFVLLLVIMDPLVSVAAFLSMTKKLDKKERNICATKAVLVAAAPLFLFLVCGTFLLEIMKVDIQTFKAAGGLILVLLGIQLSLGVSFKKDESDEDMHDVSAIAAVIGTPLITGPATIAATIMLTNEFGASVTAVAGAGALIVIWLTLLGGSLLHKYLGHTGIRVLSTMMGLVTIAWGVAFLKSGFFGP
jgi:multiple antibiotic resistance protein